MRYVVAGLHAAGREACKWLRKADPSAEIIGLDPSAGPLYSRPLISYALAGEMAPEAMTVAGEDYWTRYGVTIIKEKAVALDPARAALTLASGREVAYDRLLLACGASPRTVEAGGSMAGEICYFRGKRDLERILGRVKPGGEAAVLGGGLVGYKLTMGLIARGMRVTLVVTSPRPLSLNVDAHVGDWAAGRLNDEPGVTLVTSTSVTAVEPGQGGRLKLLLDSGGPLEVDLAAAGKGVSPAIGWLADSGLDMDYGLLVDGALRTSDERIFAAGDLAQAPEAASGDRRVNAIWPVAVEQGRVAAMNMAGFHAPYPGSLAMNSIPIFGAQMISVGAVNPALTGGCEFVEAECGRGGYLKLIFREKRLVGAVGLDAPPRLGELAFAVKRGLRRRDVPARWLANAKNAAPLAAPGRSLAGNARLV